jgi:hypothetical protein
MFFEKKGHGPLGVNEFGLQPTTQIYLGLSYGPYEACPQPFVMNTEVD